MVCFIRILYLVLISCIPTLCNFQLVWQPLKIMLQKAFQVVWTFCRATGEEGGMMWNHP